MKACVMEMNIDASVLISALAVVLSLIFGISNIKRGNKEDTKNDTTQLTTVIVKLETIKDGISEIKNDMKNIRNSIQELRERIAKAESAISSAHKRLDELSKEQRKD